MSKRTIEYFRQYPFEVIGSCVTTTNSKDNLGERLSQLYFLIDDTGQGFNGKSHYECFDRLSLCHIFIEVDKTASREYYLRIARLEIQPESAEVPDEILILLSELKFQRR